MMKYDSRMLQEIGLSLLFINYADYLENVVTTYKKRASQEHNIKNFQFSLRKIFINYINLIIR